MNLQCTSADSEFHHSYTGYPSKKCYSTEFYVACCGEKFIMQK